MRNSRAKTCFFQASVSHTWFGVVLFTCISAVCFFCFGRITFSRAHNEIGFAWHSCTCAVLILRDNHLDPSCGFLSYVPSPTHTRFKHESSPSRWTSLLCGPRVKMAWIQNKLRRIIGASIWCYKSSKQTANHFAIRKQAHCLTINESFSFLQTQLIQGIHSETTTCHIVASSGTNCFWAVRQC